MTAPTPGLEPPPLPARDVVGEEAPGRRHLRLWALAGAVLLVLGLLAADRVVRSREVDTLLDAVQRGQSTVHYADRRISATVSYALPLLFSPRTTRQVRESLQQLVQDSAAGQVPAVRQAEARVRATRVLPWHGEQRRAQQDYAAYLAAQTAYLEAIAAEARQRYRPQPELQQRRRAALASLMEAADEGQVARVRQLMPERPTGTAG